MNIKAVVTEADLHDVFPVLQQLRTKISRRGKFFISKMKEEITNYFRYVTKRMKLLV